MLNILALNYKQAPSSQNKKRKLYKTSQTQFYEEQKHPQNNRELVNRLAKSAMFRVKQGRWAIKQALTKEQNEKLKIKSHTPTRQAIQLITTHCPHMIPPIEKISIVEV